MLNTCEKHIFNICLNTCVAHVYSDVYVIHMKYICIVQYMFNMCGEIGCV